MNTLANRVLVLNKCWQPLGTVDAQRAIVMLFSTYSNGEHKARIVDYPSYELMTWEDWSQI